MMRWKARSMSARSGMGLLSPCPLPAGERGIRQHRDGGDLDQGARAQEAGHDHAGGGREASLEDLAPDVRGLAIVLGGGDVLGGLHDVLEAAARRGQELAELLEDIASLGHDVAGPDDRPALVARGRARDEEQVARPHRRRERVAGRPGARARDHLVRGHRTLLWDAGGIAAGAGATAGAAGTAGSYRSRSWEARRGTRSPAGTDADRRASSPP